MNEQVIKVMCTLIRKEICIAEASEPINYQLIPKILPQLYALSKAHDMAHIISQALNNLGMLGEDEDSRNFQNQQMLAVYRYQQIIHSIDEICIVMEKNQIPFVLLKGAVIRRYYPEPYLRTSCDIDILVRGEHLDTIKSVLHNELNINYKSTWHHEHSFYSQNGVHIEFHDSLNDEAHYRYEFLENVWNFVEQMKNSEYGFELSDEMFYFYHIAHMAKHIEYGGCGIRPFLDLWILDHRVQYDLDRRNQLLEEGKLLIFADACRKLSEVWFSNVQPDDVSVQMQKYILHGGVYGNLDNRVAVQQKRCGGKVRYIMSRIFLPYDSLKVLYPTLQKHRWLMPIMQVRRWFRLLLKGRMKQSLHELNVNKTMAQEKIAETAELLTKLGLQ